MSVETLIALLGPLHPPFVHFAVACPILAFFAIALQGTWKKEWLGFAAAGLWIFAFLSALAAGVSGHLFSLHLGLESDFSILPPESADHGRLRDHVLWGSGASVFSFLTLWAAVKTFQGKPFSWNVQLLLGLASALLVGVTGHEGGEMVYGSEPSAAPVSAVLTPSAAASAGAEPAPAMKKKKAEAPSDLLSLTQDYRTALVKMNSRPWNSRTHGHRWVNTYVSRKAVAAYQEFDPLPEGSQVVKESFEDEGGKPSAIPGPLYVMVKGAGSSSPLTGGWQYALAWEKPVANNPENIQMPVKWLPGDPHLNSCVKCHNHFKSGDYLGGVPDGFEKKQ